MQEIKTWTGFKKTMNNILIQMLQKTAEIAAKIIDDYVLENLYAKYQPTNYIRTYDYINSLTIGDVQKVANGYEIMIFFDSTKIRSHQSPIGEWNQHMSTNKNNSSTWHGQSINELIPIWIEYGVSGSMWDRSGIKVMKNVRRELRTTRIHIRKIRQLLLQKGIKMTIKR